MSGEIFINYRREDDPGFVHALHSNLRSEFSEEQLFMDRDGKIKPGVDFIDFLDSMIDSSDVMLVILGRNWLKLLKDRTNETDDFVQFEIRAALEKNKVVIPVLVGGAGFPKPEALPEAIRSLSRRSAVVLRRESFQADCRDLIASLNEHLAAINAEREERAKIEREKIKESSRKGEVDDNTSTTTQFAEAKRRNGIAAPTPTQHMGANNITRSSRKAKYRKILGLTLLGIVLGIAISYVLFPRWTYCSALGMIGYRPFECVAGG